MSGQIKSPIDEAILRKPTPRAQKVLSLAREEAELLNHAYIGAEHLLLGLLRLDGGTSVKVLKSLGVDLPAVRAAVQVAAGLGLPFPAKTFPYTPRARMILASANVYAKRFEHRFIGTEHLLLGLLAEEDQSLAGRILIQNFRLNLTEMRTAIEKELTRGLNSNETNPSTGQNF